MNACERKRYPSDVTDAQWGVLEPLLLAFEDRVRPGPERAVDLREVVNTLYYQNRTGCQWAFLPHDLLPKSTVYDYFGFSASLAEMTCFVYTDTGVRIMTFPTPDTSRMNYDRSILAFLDRVVAAT